ncbi:MAG: hypothetical protein LUC34_01885, partial [Campylobacter sp.]|nr:hypothetical protein [Campylobacter sp.]
IAQIETKQEKPLNLNDIAKGKDLSSLGLKKASELNQILSQEEKEQLMNAAETSQTQDIIEIQIEPEANEPLPHDLLEQELIKRGLTQNEAENLILRYSVEQVKEILNDPSSIDEIIKLNFKG